MKYPGNSQVMQLEAWDAAYLTNPDIEPHASPPRVDVVQEDFSISCSYSYRRRCFPSIYNLLLLYR